MNNSSQSTRPVGRVLWKELLEEVILHINPLFSLLHTLLKDKCREHIGSVVEYLRLRGHGFEPHRRHCVVVFEQDTFILA